MPNRLRYHERRLIAKGLAKASDFEKKEIKSKDNQEDKKELRRRRSL